MPYSFSTVSWLCFSTPAIVSKFFSVEPQYTTSETLVKVDGSDIDDSKSLTIETRASVPFLFDLENKDDIIVSFTPEKSVDDMELPLAQLIDWNVSDSVDGSSKAFIFCRFELDSEKVLQMENLPVLEVNIMSKDGIRKHSHATALELGKSRLLNFYLI